VPPVILRFFAVTLPALVTSNCLTDVCVPDELVSKALIVIDPPVMF